MKADWGSSSPLAIAFTSSSLTLISQSGRSFISPANFTVTANGRSGSSTLARSEPFNPFSAAMISSACFRIASGDSSTSGGESCAFILRSSSWPVTDWMKFSSETTKVSSACGSRPGVIAVLPLASPTVHSPPPSPVTRTAALKAMPGVKASIRGLELSICAGSHCSKKPAGVMSIGALISSNPSIIWLSSCS